MRIQSTKTISYSPKIISHKGDGNKSYNAKNEKEQNPYKLRNIFIGFVLGFLFSYAISRLYAHFNRFKDVVIVEEMCKG